MRLEEVATLVEGVLHMSVAQARQIYDHFGIYRPASVLELGFAHGVSTCYLAGALQEVGGESVTTIDIVSALKRQPDIHTLLGRCGLEHLVDVRTHPTSYTWELMGMLEAEPHPEFDFVYVDGAHLWDVDGFAFFLVDRLLAPGGWILFDDLDWTLARSPSMAEVDWVRRLPAEQRETKQVRKVFELLVRSHENYGEFRDEAGWGWARKTGGSKNRRLRFR